MANFPLVVGIRFSKLERIGINLNNIGITVMMGLIRNEFVCLKKVANFRLVVGIRFSKLERIEINLNNIGDESR